MTIYSDKQEIDYLKSQGCALARGKGAGENTFDERGTSGGFQGPPVLYFLTWVVFPFS